MDYIIKLDMISYLFVAVLVLLIGYFLKDRVKFLSKFCIPAPVIGGILFSVLVLILKVTNIATFETDNSLQTPLMLTFFCTIGLGASFKLLKTGGKILLIYWLFCGILAIAQNIIGVSVAKILGINPLIGVLAGSISMEGGHGAAAAFGSTLEQLGVHGATTIGLATATFGLIAGGLVGGPIANFLIKRHNLSKEDGDYHHEYHLVDADKPKEDKKITVNNIFVHLLILTLCIVVGGIICDTLSSLLGIVFPDYAGVMFLAVILRNLNDRFKVVTLNLTIIEFVSELSLGVFLAMSLMSLELWQLVNLALPLLIIVLCQIIFVVLYSIFVCFRFLGKDYDAAVIISGLAGHGLGATPNAIANMGAVCEKYGSSAKAFLVVPLVGAFLIDMFGIPCIIFFINIFK